MPMSFHPGHVHTYLLEDDDGFVVFDSGHIGPDCEAAWKSFLDSELGSRGIKQIMLTHTHPDHSGKAEWLWQQTNAQVWMAEAEEDAVKRLWRRSCKHENEMSAFFAQWGVPEEHFNNILSMFKGFRMGTSDFEDTPIHTIESNQRFEWAGDTWQVLFSYGHTPCNVCFYQADKGYMITGDQILPSIFPNISVWWGSDENPLQLYLDSLLELKVIPAQLLMPSHGMPFSDLQKRINQIVQFHRKRLVRLLKFLNDEPKTAYESIAAILPKSEKTWTISLVVGQVFALLRYLHGKGLIVQIGDDVWSFQALPQALSQLADFPELASF
ncbi:MAG: MBL fold metallo-hydrolase [Pseudomonadales bacterium]|nr:MBL fold metallo-hydrolase [Pseudomonadales bacterium]